MLLRESGCFQLNELIKYCEFLDPIISKMTDLLCVLFP
jgi:hypothetical protein